LTDRERWVLRRRYDEGFQLSVPWLDPILARILYARHIDSPASIHQYLAPPEAPSSDPLMLPDMPLAVERIEAALAADEQIVVYGDFDADGMCATALLVSALRRRGARVKAYIPDRFDEGYGLNAAAVESIYAEGTRLLITVDCGIRSYTEVALARAIGLEVIITDHHSVPDALPPANAVVDPKRPDSRYPFSELSGTGVAYALAQTLLGSAAEEYLDLVAVATVADIVPLCDENRALVRVGLERLRHQPRPGLAALMQAAGVVAEQARSSDVAFRLAPRLNAAGRLANARLGYDLLASETIDEARPLAAELDALNQKRQELLEQQCHQARQLLAPQPDDLCLFVAAEGLHQGLVGLIASRLCEEHYRPAFVMTASDGAYTGSARSIEGFHVTRALEGCADLLLRFGGHEAAAGFTLPVDNYDVFASRLLAQAADALSDQDLVPSRRVDAIVSLGELSVQTPLALDALGPFGEGHPEPLLASRGVVIREVRRMGRDGRHLRLRVSSDNGSIKCVGWGMGALGEQYAAGQCVDLLYSPEVDTYNGNASLQLSLVSMRPAQ
jgi:single-stranded-DNA-specific exonuclease